LIAVSSYSNLLHFNLDLFNLDLTSWIGYLNLGV
jgi:hypothetical protein